LEVAKIGRYKSIAEMMKCADADKQIRERDNDAFDPSLRIDLRNDPADLSRKRLNRHCRENRVQIDPSFESLLRRLGSMDTMLQFNHADSGKDNLRLIMLLLKTPKQSADGQCLSL